VGQRKEIRRRNRATLALDAGQSVHQKNRSGGNKYDSGGGREKEEKSKTTIKGLLGSDGRIA